MTVAMPGVDLLNPSHPHPHRLRVRVIAISPQAKSLPSECGPSPAASVCKFAAPIVSHERTEVFYASPTRSKNVPRQRLPRLLQTQHINQYQRRARHATTSPRLSSLPRAAVAAAFHMDDQAWHDEGDCRGFKPALLLCASCKHQYRDADHSRGPVPKLTGGP